ncbi:MAG: outer membrane beta-barrel protein [candidate division Zixibacteria bacterium]|nr:outer membrane beta-barrel protein [candidate division Zixibacteria bacterium]
MNRISILVTVLLVLTLSCVALAQEDEETGDILEITLSGGMAIPMSGLADWQTGFDLEDQPEIVDRAPNNGWDIGIDVGYFINPKLIVGLNFTYTAFGIDTDVDLDHRHRLFSPALYGKYYFEGETNLVPYVKASVGLENAKFSTFVENPGGRRFREISYDPTLFYAAALGLFYYTADYSGVFIEADYKMASAESTESVYLDDTYLFGENIAVLQINFGVRLLVGSGD